MISRDKLFEVTDELEFKRQYVINFLASHDAVHYNENCDRGWKTHYPLVNDACYLAEKAWSHWLEVIGVR